MLLAAYCPSTRDLRPSRTARAAFGRVRRLEADYGRRLRSVAANVGALVRGYHPADLQSSTALATQLDHYATVLRPWAEVVGLRMVQEVEARDTRGWERVAAQISQGLRRELGLEPVRGPLTAHPVIGAVVRERLAEQVQLITSIPRESAERVRTIATEHRASGQRASVLADKIMETGEVAKSRANLIARTETGRTATELTRARAERVGSPGYYWRAAMDGDTRPSHKKLNGTFHRWTEPPITDPPDKRAHPGCIFNCRCWADVVLPGDEGF